MGLPCAHRLAGNLHKMAHVVRTWSHPVSHTGSAEKHTVSGNWAHKHAAGEGRGERGKGRGEEEEEEGEEGRMKKRE